MATTKKKSYVGVAPLTMVRTKTGGYLNVFDGDPVPEDITAEDLARLVKDGFLAEAEEPEAEEPADDKGKA